MILALLAIPRKLFSPNLIQNLLLNALLNALLSALLNALLVSSNEF